MDKQTYLKMKAEQKEKEAQKFQREDFCFSCFRLQKNCLCELIKPFDTKIKFVLLIHPMEAKKEKIGTGRITIASLKNSQLIMGIDFTENEEVNQLINDPRNFCMTMYPGENSINVSTDDVDSLIKIQNEGKQLVIFLIDGTWPCAKKMMKLSKNINSLPRISFTPNKKSIFEIKEQPADYCLSTLESVHVFLDEAKKVKLETIDQEHDQMLVVFKGMIDFQKQCSTDPSLSHYGRGTPGKGFSNPENRRKPNKFQKGHRKIIHQ